LELCILDGKRLLDRGYGSKLDIDKVSTKYSHLKAATILLYLSYAFGLLVNILDVYSFIYRYTWCQCLCITTKYNV